MTDKNKTLLFTEDGLPSSVNRMSEEKKSELELSIKRSPYLKPKCIKNKSPKGVGYSSLGWLIPCCWTDPRRGAIEQFSLLDNPLFKAMFTEELKLSNVEKIEEIVYSEPWKNFGRALLHEPEKCPAECHKYCGSDLPDDGFVYKEKPTATKYAYSVNKMKSQHPEHNKQVYNDHMEDIKNDKKLYVKFRKPNQSEYDNHTVSRHYPPEAYETHRKDGDPLKRYDYMKKAGQLPRHHYTDEEWRQLLRQKKYHDWKTDENRPLGGAHQSKVSNYGPIGKLRSRLRDENKVVLRSKDRNFVFNDKKREDDDQY